MTFTLREREMDCGERDASYVMRAVSIAAFVLLASCAGSTNASSLQGKWVLNAPVPKEAGLNNQYVALDFEDTSHVAISWLPQRSMYIGMMDRRGQQKALHPKVRTERYDYQDLGKGRLRIISGGQAQDYQAEIRDDKLFFTPIAASTGNAELDAASGQSTTVFVRAK